MLNGKKIFRVSLLGIFGCLFLTGNVHGYTLTENCYCTTPTNCNNTKMACVDLELGETFSFTDVNGDTFYSTIDNTINFETNENLYVFTRAYGFNGSNRYDNRYYSYFNEDGYINTLHSAYKNSSPTLAFLYSGLHYVFIEDTTDNQNFYIVGTTSQFNRLYTGTVEEAKQILSSANVIGRRILPYGNNISASSFTQIGICLMLDNNKAICSRLLGSNTVGLGYTNANAYPTGTGINLGYSINIDNITVEYLQNNFGLSSSPFEIQPQGETTTETTPILGQCPTVREILSTYGSEYNTGICYSATRLLTQTGIVNTTEQSIFDLYPTFTDWLQDYNYYKQYCDNVPTSVCREAFSGNEIKWSLLNKTPQDNPIAIYQYCHMQLNIEDKNATTCVMSTGYYYATGVNEAIIEEIQGNQSVLDIMLNSFNNLKDELPSFSTGTVFDEFLEEGETRKDGFKLDIFKTFLELWSKITSIFIFRHQYDGIIPTYITSIIMIILLFKILKK